MRTIVIATMLSSGLASGVAVAAPAAPELLLVKDIRTTRTMPSGGSSGMIEYATFVAPTRLATTALDLAMEADAHVSDGGYAHTGETHCKVTLATTRAASWACSTGFYVGGLLGAEIRTTMMEIDGEVTRRVAYDELYGGKLDAVVALKGPDGCVHPSNVVGFHVGADGVTPYGSEGGSPSPMPCRLAWKQVAPLLAPKWRWLATFDAKTLAPAVDYTRTWKAGTPRFEARGGGVLDRATGLVWAERDNGSDVTWAEATAYVAGYRGGGHTDWRMPTDAELAAFVDRDTAHREKGDCTGGVAQYLTTPLVHLSCGLVWSSVDLGRRAAAFGYLTGTARISAVTERKNFRALPVRKP